MRTRRSVSWMKLPRVVFASNIVVRKLAYRVTWWGLLRCLLLWCLLLWGLASQSGCSADTLGSIDAQIKSRAASEPTAELDSFELDGDDIDDALDAELESTESRYVANFPNRKNPFEFLVDVSVIEGPPTGEEGFKIGLIGIFGDAPNQRVLLRVGDRFKRLAAGEKWGPIEVIAIASTSARIKVEGVTENHSLLHRKRNSGS